MKQGIIGLAVAILCAGATAWAADSGDLVFPDQYASYQARAEILYENMQRDIRVTSPGRDKIELDADVFALRLQTDIGKVARMDFDVGAMSAGSGSHKLVYGVGLRYLAMELDNWRVGTFGQVRYARNLSDSADVQGMERARLDYNLVEADAGLLVSYRIPVADQFVIAPYVGPVFSIVRLSGDVRDRDTQAKSRFRAEEDQIFGVAAGVGFELQGKNGLRFETRYFGDFSVSVAASFVF